MNITNEWRCTRSDPYKKRCPGQSDINARQGYYIKADTKEQALQAMKRAFPYEKNFTADLWVVGVPN